MAKEVSVKTVTKRDSANENTSQDERDKRDKQDEQDAITAHQNRIPSAGKHPGTSWAHS